MAWLLVSILEMADLLGVSRRTISQVYREWAENEEVSVEWHQYGQNAFLMSEIGEEWADWFEMIERQQLRE